MLVSRCLVWPVTRNIFRYEFSDLINFPFKLSNSSQGRGNRPHLWKGSFDRKGLYSQISVRARDGQDTLKNILLQDTVIGKIKYLITKCCYSQKKYLNTRY